MTGRTSIAAAFAAGLVFAHFAFAEPAYTNHAGNAVAGRPVRLTATHVTLAEGAPLATNHKQLATTYPLSIFPEAEQRRIAADFVIGQGGGQTGLLRVPDSVKRAVSGAEKAMARSRKRAEKGLCTKEASDGFCEKSAAALGSYLDRLVEDGTITPEERKALGM